MDKTLYVTDLDGTLLNTKDRIDDFSIRTINELTSKGMLFTYATARSLVSASKVTEGLSVDIPIIAYNGAFIMKPSTGEILSEEGYTEEERPHDTEQFDVSDQRTLDEVVRWLMENDHVPSFCTACYREGRTGDRFMSLLKSGQIANCCQPNAMMTLKEFLMDYASEETKAKGDALIEEKLSLIPNEKVRELCRQHLKEIENGNRDFRF